jgi:hypothetical protein
MLLPFGMILIRASAQGIILVSERFSNSEVMTIRGDSSVNGKRESFLSGCPKLNS